MTQQSTCITTLNLCIPSLFTFFCVQISHKCVNFICEKSHIFLSVYLSSGLISCKDFDHDIHWSIFITFSRSKSSIYFWICSTEKCFLDLLLGYLWLPILPRKSNISRVGLPQINVNWPCILITGPSWYLCIYMKTLNK